MTFDTAAAREAATLGLSVPALHGRHASELLRLACARVEELEAVICAAVVSLRAAEVLLGPGGYDRDP